MKPLPLLMSFISFLLAGNVAASFNENEKTFGVFVDGYVTTRPNAAPYPFSAHEPVTVYAVRGNDTIDVAHTGADGYYAFQNIPVWMLEHEKPSLETKMYPNPYKNSTNIEMFAPKKSDYQLMMFNVENMKLTFSKKIEGLEGNSTINIAGGNAGIYTVLLQNKDTTYKFKAIQIEGDGSAIDVNVSHPSTSKEMMFDQVKFVYVNPKYEKPDTNLTLSSSSIHLGNRDIWKLKDVYNFTAIALTHKDTVRTNGAIKINWNNGSGDEFTYNANQAGPNAGKINVIYHY